VSEDKMNESRAEAMQDFLNEHVANNIGDILAELSDEGVMIKELEDRGYTVKKIEDMTIDNARDVLREYILFVLGSNENEPVDVRVLDEGNGITKLECILSCVSEHSPRLKKALQILKNK
jgi:hypothetical protein